MNGQPMPSAIAESELQRFRAAIVRQIGLQFDDAKLAFLSGVLRRRLDRLHCSSDSYLKKLEAEQGDSEYSALAQELTVGETYFFRHNDQFRARPYVPAARLRQAPGTDRCGERNKFRRPSALAPAR